MRLISEPPLSIEFKCFHCFGHYAIEESDLRKPVDAGGVHYGSLYSTFRCPYCKADEVLSWSMFPKRWIDIVQAK